MLAASRSASAREGTASEAGNHCQQSSDAGFTCLKSCKIHDQFSLAPRHLNAILPLERQELIMRFYLFVLQ